MDLREIYDLFDESTMENFPVKRCIHKHPKCEDFRYSRLWYTCILTTKRDKGELWITNLRPIIKTEADGKIIYGWINEHDWIFDNLVNSFNDTNEKVIAFKENDYDLKEEFFHELWNY